MHLDQSPTERSTAYWNLPNWLKTELGNTGQKTEWRHSYGELVELADHGECAEES